MDFICACAKTLKCDSYFSLYSWAVFSCLMTHFLPLSDWLAPWLLRSFFDLLRLKMTVLYYHLSIWVIFHSFLVIIRVDLYVWLYFLEYYFMCVIYDVFMHFSMRPHLYAYFTSSINK